MENPHYHKGGEKNKFNPEALTTPTSHEGFRDAGGCGGEGGRGGRGGGDTDYKVTVPKKNPIAEQMLKTERYL